jgi:hypothetical protein
VGSIYVNVPGLVYPNCSSMGSPIGQQVGVGNDICIHNSGNTDQTIVQFNFTQPDITGSNMREIISAVGTTRMVGTFSTFRLLNDGSWGFYPLNYLNKNRNAETFMAKMPPWSAADSVNRTTFVPVVVSLHAPPAGTNNAIVDFGYQENGTPTNLYCTTRADVCVANNAGLVTGNSPFQFASESPPGVLCSTSCTITVPAIPSRVLYYRYSYRDASNAVLFTSSVQIAVVN